MLITAEVANSASLRLPPRVRRLRRWRAGLHCADCRRTRGPAFLLARLTAGIGPRSVAGHVRAARGGDVGHGFEPRCCGWRCRLPRGRLPRLPNRGFDELGWGLGDVVHRDGTGFTVSRRAMTTNGPPIAARGRTGRRPYLYIAPAW